MCGIAGIISKKVSLNDEDIIKKMLREISHRGPDYIDQKIINNKAVFGHCRLAIIDHQNCNQPIVSDDKRFILIFNGEIYNYLELKDKLISKGIKFKTNSDTEVLLKLLINFKEEAISMLNGMFAFSFYDKQSGKWILARDHFGIKPLYYVKSNDNLIFASEIKAILKHPAIRAKCAEENLSEYIFYQFCIGEKTLFKDIKKVEPAHFIVGQDDQIIKVKKFWTPSYNINLFQKEDECSEELYNLIENSISLQLKSDFPVGGYLSGGIDSSLICSIANKISGECFKMFHGKFDEGTEYDESEYAKLVCKNTNGKIIITTPNENDFVETLPKLIYMLDEPVAGPGSFPQFFVSKEASQHVKVVLGGQGGDEIFGGYTRYLIGYLEQTLKGSIFENNNMKKHIINLKSIIPQLNSLKNYGPLLSHFFKQDFLDPMDKRYLHLIDRSSGIIEIISKDLQNKISFDQVYQNFQNIFNSTDTKSYINKMTAFDQKTLLPALLQVEDRMSMASSIEGRIPLLDKRIVEFMSTVQPKIKFKNGHLKYLLKKVSHKIIPSKIVKRTDKMGFPVPLNPWLKRTILPQFINDILLSKKSLERGIFKKSFLKNISNYNGVSNRTLWGALSLELWFRSFIDAK